MEMGGRVRLNVSSKSGGSSDQRAVAELNRLGLGHFGFAVEDLEVELDQLGGGWNPGSAAAYTGVRRDQPGLHRGDGQCPDRVGATGRGRKGLNNSLDQLRTVVSYRVHPGGNRKGLHHAGGVEQDQFLQVGHILVGQVQPQSRLYIQSKSTAHGCASESP
jgi:hypothetical protein